MFSKKRHSRGPEQPVNTGAMAAASAIGKAITNNGRAVDHTKLPAYNKVPVEIKRSASMMGSRRESLQRGPAMGSRNNSLSNANNNQKNTINSSRSRNSLRSINDHRTQSLQSQKRAPSRSNSVTNRSRDSVADPQRAFHEFGGLQASGVIHKPADGPRMVKKYVPSANGLVAIEVPETSLSQRRTPSLRRSSSAGRLSVSRSGSLVKRKASTNSSNSEKRFSSLTESSSSARLHSASTKTGTKVESHPLIESYVEEETELELRQDVIRPMTISQEGNVVEGSNHSQVPKSTDLKVELAEENIIASPAVVEPEEQESTALEVPSESTEEKEKAALQTSSASTEGNNPPTAGEAMITTVMDTVAAKKEHISQVEDAESQDETTKGAELEGLKLPKADEQSREQQAEQKSEIKDEEEKNVLPEINQIKTSNTEFFDTQEFVKTPSAVDSADVTPASSVGRESNNTTSLAQHLRAINPYLNQQDTSTNERTYSTSEIESAKSNTDNLKINDKNLYKVPSPMKSALKKSTTRSSATSSIYSEYSPANDAYLSLTTAENTRLNAKLANADTPTFKPRHPARPQSMVNSATNRSSSPIPKDAKKSRHSSVGPQQKGTNRNSVYKASNDSNIAIDAAKASANSNRAKTVLQASGKPQHNVSQDQNMSKKAPSDSRSSTVNTDILYPKEPPQKRSSFEKLRNQEGSHLGFKKLSLRDESITDMSYENGIKSVSNRNSTLGATSRQKNDGTLTLHDASQNFLQNSGWKSRIHDSDSDEDGAIFSSAGTSRSTQSTSNGNQFENPSGNSGFGFFKKGNKTPQQNDTAVDLAPPQPRYLDSNLTKQKSSADSTTSAPGKINRKWSKMSLRSSSTGDMQEPSLDTPKKISTPKRFHSHANTDSGVKTSKTLRANVDEGVGGDETPTKKKNAFGKKLKKLFGRKP